MRSPSLSHPTTFGHISANRDTCGRATRDRIALCFIRVAAYKYPRIAEIVEDISRTVTGKNVEEAVALVTPRHFFSGKRALVVSPRRLHGNLVYSAQECVYPALLLLDFGEV